MQVATIHGTSHSLSRAVLLTGQPVLHAIIPLAAGCLQPDPHTLTECSLTGIALGLRGEGLLAYHWAIAVGPYHCQDIRYYNETYVECHGLIGSGVGHTVAVRVGHPSLTSAPAVPFTVSFADPCATKVGYWAGDTCDLCHEDYYGPACLSPGSAGPRVRGARPLQRRFGGRRDVPVRRGRRAGALGRGHVRRLPHRLRGSGLCGPVPVRRCVWPWGQCDVRGAWRMRRGCGREWRVHLHAAVGWGGM